MDEAPTLGSMEVVGKSLSRDFSASIQVVTPDGLSEALSPSLQLFHFIDLTSKHSISTLAQNTYIFSSIIS